tara:strand:+ start:5305 stop:6579 length:1275 start_codon:yes stop_codon:yes gene_type:complete
MATASKIKSSIRSRGASQRQLTGQLAGVSEQLMKAQESSMMAQLEEKEQAAMFGTLSAGLEAGASFLEGVKQRQELQSNIDFLSESLGEQGKELSMVRGDKSSLMDVFSGKASVSSYLFGQQQYQLDGKNVGSKYDVSAMGERARALQQDNMLDTFLGADPLSKKQDVGLDTLESPKMPSITGRPTPLQERAEGDGPSGLESPKEIKLPTKQDTMMDKVGEKIEKGTLVKSDGNVIPEKIVNKTKMSAEQYLETDPPNAIKEMIQPSYPKEDKINDFLKPSVDQPIENEKLSSFLPDYLQSKDEPLLGPVIDRPLQERALQYSFDKPSTKRLRSPQGGAKLLKDKIKDLKVAQDNLKGARPSDKFNKERFSKIVNERSSELESLISEIYNPQLDLFYGDDSSGITLRKQLGSDSIKFIKQLASK